ncbi:hypothetical protein DFH11DRAFT_1647603 [Phellopilus nigrolimitatus]|nr:hypothetical protein DFH11DRAFT_1647603 [Phellopilus nigrolimitatus]
MGPAIHMESWMSTPCRYIAPSPGRLLTALRDNWAVDVKFCPTLHVGLRIFDALAKVAADITFFEPKQDALSSLLPTGANESMFKKELVYRDMLAHKNVCFMDNRRVCPDPELDMPAFLSSFHDSSANSRPLPDVQARPICAIDIPASLSGLGSLQLQLPNFLGKKIVGAPAPVKHLADLGKLALRSSIIPSGGITHVRMDCQSQLVAEIGPQSKLWLLWPPLKVNFDFMCRNMENPTSMESTVEAIDNLKGLQLLPRFGRPSVFYLPAYYIHAVLTISTSIHSSLPCYNYGEFSATLDLIKSHASYSGGRMEGYNAIRDEIDMWVTLASSNYGALDEMDRPHFHKKINEISTLIDP